MKGITIAFILVLLLMSLSFLTTEKEKTDPSTLENTSISNDLWRLDSIAKYSFSEDMGWYPSRFTSKHYIKDSILIGSVSYSDYSLETNKYANRREYQTSINLDASHKIEPIKDTNFINWDKKEGIIFVSNSTANKEEEYQYRYRKSKDDWYFYSLKSDSFDNHQVNIQRYFYSDIDPGNYPIQESKELYLYEDTLLIEETLIGRKGNAAWKESKKELWSYENDQLISYKLFFFYEPAGEWKLSEEDSYEYGPDTKTNTYFDYNTIEKTKTGYKAIEKFDKEGNLIQKNHLKWNDTSQEFKHAYKKEIRLENTLVKEIVKSDYEEDGYDENVTTNRYDSKGRLIKIVRKNKNEEDQDWKILEERIYEYEGDHSLPYMVRELNSKRIISQETKIIFDKLQNPIKRVSKRNGRTYELHTKHDYTIKTADIIASDDSKIFETHIDENIWKHPTAPKEEISYHTVNGKQKKFKKSVYFYSRLEN